MARDKSLDKKMNDIAHFVADRILGNEQVDSELNAAFKTLAAYWASATKLDKVPDEDDAATSGSFGAIKQRIREAGNGPEAETTGSDAGGGVTPFPARKSGGEPS